MWSEIITTDEFVSKKWHNDSRDKVLNILADDLFPCIFAKKAAMKQTILWLFYDNSEKQKFIKGLIEYTNFIKNTLPKKRILRPLVVICKCNKSTLVEQHKFAWKLIQYIVDNDPLPWIVNIPTNPNSHRWCLCFNQTQLFVNISTPGHKILKNRNLGQNICIVINPREIFDIVAPHATKKGKKSDKQFESESKYLISQTPFQKNWDFLERLVI